MAALDDHGVLGRKLAQAAALGRDAATAGPGADRSWRVVLARAARDAMALGLDVTRLDNLHASLAELLDMPPDRALIAVLEGPAEGLGLMAISGPVLAAMTEMQTIGRVATTEPAPRKPTRTDAAMVAGFVDTALAGLEAALAEQADLVWAGGFRYASFLDDPRPLGLVLEDFAYRVLVADVTVEGGARSGQLLLALPAVGRGQRPKPVVAALPSAHGAQDFAADLALQIEAAPCVLQAVVHRQSCPLSAVIALQVGDVLPMELASLDRVWFETLDGQQIASGRLGQNRGMRAVRLTPGAAPKMPAVQASQDIVDLQPVAAAG